MKKWYDVEDLDIAIYRLKQFIEDALTDTKKMNPKNWESIEEYDQYIWSVENSIKYLERLKDEQRNTKNN